VAKSSIHINEEKKKKNHHLEGNDQYQDHTPKFLEVSLSPSNVTLQQSTWKIKTEIFLGTTANYSKILLSFNHQDFQYKVAG